MLRNTLENIRVSRFFSFNVEYSEKFGSEICRPVKINYGDKVKIRKECTYHGSLTGGDYDEIFFIKYINGDECSFKDTFLKPKEHFSGYIELNNGKTYHHTELLTP